MDIALIALGLMAMSSLLIFFIFQPRGIYGPQRRALSIFNACIVFIVLLLCGVLFLFMHARYSVPPEQYYLISESERDMWKTFALAGGFVIAMLMFFLAWLARNFWIFKPPRISGRPW